MRRTSNILAFDPNRPRAAKPTVTPTVSAEAYPAIAALLAEDSPFLDALEMLAERRVQKTG